MIPVHVIVLDARASRIPDFCSYSSSSSSEIEMLLLIKHTRARFFSFLHSFPGGLRSLPPKQQDVVVGPYSATACSAATGADCECNLGARHLALVSPDQNHTDLFAYEAATCTQPLAAPPELKSDVACLFLGGGSSRPMMLHPACSSPSSHPELRIRPARVLTSGDRRVTKSPHLAQQLPENYISHCVLGF